MNVITIGVYLTEDKKEGISWSAFVKLCEEYNSYDISHGNQIELIDLDESNYKTIKTKFVLTKFDEFYMNNTTNEKLLTWLATQTNLIDPLNNQMNLGNRLIMADKLAEVSTNFKNIFVPEYTYTTKLNYCPELKFPIICKPNVAFGSVVTHSMCIVDSFESLIIAKIHLPVLLQTFHEHGAVIFKVYVVRDNVSVCIKNSISFNNINEPIVYFDTSDLKKFKVEHSAEEINTMLETIKKEVDLKKLSKLLSESFGLTLFGYDLIKVNDKYAIIDINYFPGYNGCPEFHNNLLNYFIDLS